MGGWGVSGQPTAYRCSSDVQKLPVEQNLDAPHRSLSQRALLQRARLRTCPSYKSEAPLSLYVICIGTDIFDAVQRSHCK